MTNRNLSRARLLEIAPADRLTFLEEVRRRIDAEIERLQTGEVQPSSSRSRRYQLQVLYWRRQKVATLAREAGFGDWTFNPAQVA